MSSPLKIVAAIGVVVLGGAAAYLGFQLDQAGQNLAAVNAERDQLQAQVDQLKAQVDQLSAQMDQRNSKVARLEATNEQLTVANASEAREIRRESMPELPVSVHFRQAMLGRHLVAQFNSHGREMKIALDVVDAATHSHHTFFVDVSGGVRPMPWRGYDFEPGDIVTLARDGYKPVTAVARAN